MLPEDNVECRVDRSLEALRAKHRRDRVTLGRIELDRGFVHRLSIP
jgi:hypothetical protein